MKKSRFMTVALAAMLILSLTACGGEKKPAETKGSVQASQETTAVASKETEAAATETTEKETEPLETEAKIPENAEEITMTNQKLQIQAKFYLPKQEGEWEVETGMEEIRLHRCRKMFIKQRSMRMNQCM